MVTDKHKIARRFAIAYVLLGSTYFLLWHFFISPSGYTDPLTVTLFYVALPAILASPYVVYEAIAEVFRFVLRRSESSSDELKE